MSKEKSSASAESDLASALDRVADELQLVREVLDEIRTDFQWAAQNSRMVVRAVRARGLLNALGIGMLLIVFFKTVFAVLRGYLLAHIARKIDLDLMSSYLSHVVRLPIRNRLGDTESAWGGIGLGTWHH